jgi:hypothetical protein
VHFQKESHKTVHETQSKQFNMCACVPSHSCEQDSYCLYFLLLPSARPNRSISVRMQPARTHTHNLACSRRDQHATVLLSLLTNLLTLLYFAFAPPRTCSYHHHLA